MEGELPSFRVEMPPPSTLMHLPTWKVSEPCCLGILWKFRYMGWLIKSLAIQSSSVSSREEENSNLPIAGLVALAVSPHPEPLRGSPRLGSLASTQVRLKGAYIE